MRKLTSILLGAFLGFSVVTAAQIVVNPSGTTTINNSPGGSDGSIQYKNGGNFGGFGSWNGNTLFIGDGDSGSVQLINSGLVQSSIKNESGVANFVGYNAQLDDQFSLTLYNNGKTHINGPGEFVFNQAINVSSCTGCGGGGLTGLTSSTVDATLATGTLLETTGAGMDVPLLIRPKGLGNGNDFSFVFVSPNDDISDVTTFFYPAIALEGENENSGDFVIRGAGHANYFGFMSSNGTLAAKTATAVNDTLGEIDAYGYGASQWGDGSGNPSARVIFHAAGNFTDTSTPGSIDFVTLSAVAGVNATPLSLTATGAVLGVDVTISSQSGTGVQFACFDAAGKLVRSASACGS